MMATGVNSNPLTNFVDYDIHGVVGIRLVDAPAIDAAAVSGQLGCLQTPLTRDPDIVVRFTDSLPQSGLGLLGLNQYVFSEQDFFIVSGQSDAKARIAFDQVGGRCDVLCEPGTQLLPLLTVLINFTALNKGYVPLHASAFIYNGAGILVTGWKKGGKTESLLAFTAQGARYVGDEWILLSADGERMYGVPGIIWLWNWHLRHLPHIRRQVKLGKRLMFHTIGGLEALQRVLPHGRLGRILPVKFLRDAMPALRRQLGVTMEPQAVFPNAETLVARPDKLFLVMNHAKPEIKIEPIDPLVVAERMQPSVCYEQFPFYKHYLAFKFAFPQREADFIERAPELIGTLLRQALAGKEAYVVSHPYPVSLPALFAAMRPFCEATSAPRVAGNQLAKLISENAERAVV